MSPREAGLRTSATASSHRALKPSQRRRALRRHRRSPVGGFHWDRRPDDIAIRFERRLAERGEQIAGEERTGRFSLAGNRIPTVCGIFSMSARVLVAQSISATNAIVYVPECRVVAGRRREGLAAVLRSRRYS